MFKTRRIPGENMRRPLLLPDFVNGRFVVENAPDQNYLDEPGRQHDYDLKQWPGNWFKKLKTFFL